MKLTHLIFDIDGTVLDTEAQLLKATDQTLRHYGYNIDPEKIKTILGQRIEYGFEKLNVKVDENYLQIWEGFYEKYANEAKYFPEMEQVLQILKEKNVNLGIVTSRSQKEYDEFLYKFNLEKYFTTIILSDHTKRHKPDPEPINLYIQKNNAKKDQCIYIGDMPTDIICAHNAGILGANVKYNGKNLDIQDADIVIQTPKDILKLI